MRLPFSADEFFDVFARYNLAVQPAQVVLLVLAIAVLAATVHRVRESDRFVVAVLVWLWLWMAVVYHLAFFSRINPAAGLFAALFAVQALLLGRTGLVRRELSFRLALDRRSLLPIVLIAYALVGYPALGFALGQRYPAIPTFGLPCPTAIFTFGILLAARRCPLHLLVIPTAWSLLGFSAAWQLGVAPDYGLVVAGVLATIVIVSRETRAPNGLSESTTNRA